MAHGRPDLGYLYWRWKPNQCNIPRFEPKVFLHMLRNKHLAFVGDSLARNQVESLLCMLATVSTRHLVYSYKLPSDVNIRDTFRRWYFPSHNLNVSMYWSPFLARGIEATRAQDYSRIYLDSLDERWVSDLDQVNLIVISFGRWFLKPSLYFYGNSTLGCYSCTGQNYTQVRIHDFFGKILKTALDKIIETKGIDVIVATFSPDHYEGEWDNFGTCLKTQPFEEGEKQLEGIEAEMRRIELEEVEAAKIKAKKFGKIRVEVLDVTKLSLMRQDGHPGPYRVAHPFAKGVKRKVKNDCVHWCLPGPMDTWNEILLDIMKRLENI
ncbi:hypothetical protein Vadar_002567 [Vaccinium darrowii]|uniref:Uncharacterized protein n=1 Tax=Vaccinium darrowii TaxID=229202 RepID=A0ACB7YBB1_9ERIC|nr:hypothetical protein Vadar_002567 [Vaccinium darrowii]